MDVELLLDFDYEFLEDELLDFFDAALLELFEELFCSDFFDEPLPELKELFSEDSLDADEDLFLMCSTQRYLRPSSPLTPTTVLSEFLATQNSDPLKSKARMENTLIENNAKSKI